MLTFGYSVRSGNYLKLQLGLVLVLVLSYYWAHIDYRKHSPVVMYGKHKMSFKVKADITKCPASQKWQKLHECLLISTKRKSHIYIIKFCYLLRDLYEVHNARHNKNWQQTKKNRHMVKQPCLLPKTYNEEKSFQYRLNNMTKWMQLSHKIRPFTFMITINHQRETIHEPAMWQSALTYSDHKGYSHHLDDITKFWISQMSDPHKRPTLLMKYHT